MVDRWSRRRVTKPREAHIEYHSGLAFRIVPDSARLELRERIRPWRESEDGMTPAFRLQSNSQWID